MTPVDPRSTFTRPIGLFVLFSSVLYVSTGCTRHETQALDAGMALQVAPAAPPTKAVLSKSTDGAVSMFWRIGNTTFIDINNDGRADDVTTESGSVRVTETDSEGGGRGFLDRRQELHFESGRVLEVRYERDAPDAGWRAVGSTEGSTTVE